MRPFSFLLASAGFTLFAAQMATAQSLPPQASDQMVVFSTTGTQIFNNFIPDPAVSGITEGPLVFDPRTPTVPGTLGFDPGAAILAGAESMLLLDPAGEPPHPGETSVPIVLPGGTTAFLSDAVVSTLNVPSAFPPQVALFSDANQFLQEIAADYNKAPLPPTILLETGNLQPFPINPSAAAQFGVGQVLVASDVEVPEPATLSLIAVGSLVLLRRARRPL